MTQNTKDTLKIDKGGRRRIKDRRFKVSIVKISEQRTGMKRRSGRDRRYMNLDIISGIDRRDGSLDSSIA